MGEPMPQPVPEPVRSSEVPVSEEASSAKHLVSTLAHVVDDVLDSYPTTAAEAAIALVEKTTDLVTGLVHSVDGLLSGMFRGGTDDPVNDPSTPTSIPMPTAPTSVPGGGSSPAAGFLSSGSLSSGSAPALLIAVLVLFSIALLQGKLSWLRCEPLRPRAGPQLAIERPG
jgi:hypothetical protein